MYGLATLAALAATISTAAATGSAIVNNNCDFDVYLWVVSETSGSMQTIASGDNYSGAYETNPNGGGISIKLATDSDASSVTQFEYTLDDSIYYDLSNINGYPFADWGMSLSASESSCPSFTCDAGVEVCSSAYNLPDDVATLVCAGSADVTVDLCLDSSSSTKKREFVPVHSRHFHAKHHSA